MEIFGCFEADADGSDEYSVSFILRSRRNVPALEEKIKRYLKRGLKLLEIVMRDKANDSQKEKTIIVSTD